ncbi:PAP2 superfamily C-terminal-domain-containing protein [Gongronella butleri]|nr:PAP2 superfamily C-terminal-domain-containing protein [Gongronella butleri]
MLGWSSLFLSPKMMTIGSDTSPTAVAPWAESVQSIGGLRLRLEPPATVQSWRDVSALVLNHSFMRVSMASTWLFLGGIVESLLSQWSEQRYNAISTDKPVDSVNYIMTTCLIYTLAAFALQGPDWSMRFVMLRRWFVLMGFLYIFRGITLVVTTLPSPLIDHCEPSPIALHGSPGERLLYLFQVVTGVINPCTDQIFSGHTAVLMSCVMIWRIHSRMRWPYAWVLYILATAGMFVIIATHFHYTVDVLLAVFIVYTSWYIFMRNIQDATLRYSFGFMHHVTMDIFKAQINTTDAPLVYEFMNWQPKPLGSTWFMWACMYADGLDIRLRALGIFDKDGHYARTSSGGTASASGEMQETNSDLPLYENRQSLPV